MKVGLLILSALMLLVYASIRVTRYDPDLTDTYELTIRFDNVTGLAQGTAVRIAGIKVGEVAAIELVKGRAQVKVAVYEKFRLHSDALARIQSIGILGDKYIDLTLGSANQELLTQGDEIALVAPASDLDSLVSNLSQILTDVKVVTQSLRQSLGGEEGSAKVGRIVDNLDQITTDLKGTLAVTNEKIGPIMNNLEQFTGDL